MDLHTLQELDNDLTAGSDQNLTLSALFGVCDCLETIGEYGHTNHLQSMENNGVDVRMTINKGANQYLHIRTVRQHHSITHAPAALLTSIATTAAFPTQTTKLAHIKTLLVLGEQVQIRLGIAPLQGVGVNKITGG